MNLQVFLVANPLIVTPLKNYIHVIKNSYFQLVLQQSVSEVFSLGCTVSEIVLQQLVCVQCLVGKILQTYLLNYVHHT